jgi:hypothetical protein
MKAQNLEMTKVGPVIMKVSGPLLQNPIHCRSQVQLVTQSVELKSDGDGLSHKRGLIYVIRMCTLVHFHGLINNRVKVHCLTTDANGHQCPRGKLSPHHWCDGSVTHCLPTLKGEKEGE